MTLFAIQLVRGALTIVAAATSLLNGFIGPELALQTIIGIHEMLNVIIISVYFYFFYFNDDIYLSRASPQ